MLKRKMLRDMRKNKMQFFSILLLALLGVLVYAGISTMGAGLRASYMDFYEKTNFSDYWIYGKGFRTEDVDKVKALSDVSEAERRITLDTIVDAKDDPELQIHFLEKNVVNKPYLADGEEFNLEDRKGIWLDKRFADANEYKVGDSLTVKLLGGSLEVTIKGLVYGPEYVYYVSSDSIYPDFKGMGYAYCSCKTLENIDVGFDIPYTNLVVTSSCKDKDKFEESIDKALDGGYAIVIGRPDQKSHNMVAGEYEEAKSMSIIFPIVFALVALLTIVITMRRIIRKQRTQIGTLKALGFSNRIILKHYVGYGFYASFLGSVLGLIIGPIAIPSAFWPAYQTAYTLPSWHGEFQPISAVIAAVFVVFCTVSTFMVCRSVLKESAAQALRPETPKHPKQRGYMNTKWWARRSFYTQWNIRDLSRSKMKGIMGIIGTAGCMALLVSAFLLDDSFAYLKSWMYEKIDKYEYQVYFDSKADDVTKNEVLSEIEGESMMVGSIVIRKDEDSGKNTKAITVVEHGKSDLYHVVDKELETIQLKDGEVAISMQLANVLGVNKGDSIQWHLYEEEKWIESKVTIVNRVPMGQGLWMTKDTFVDSGNEYIPNIGITNKDIKNYENGAVTKVYSQADLEEAWDKGMVAFNLMIYILIIAAIVLALVVLYNIGLFSFMESQRDFAMLKVMGFQTKKIRKILMIQNLWLSVIGIILGVPVGYVMFQEILKSIGDDYDFIITIAKESVLISAAITLVTALVVNLFFSRKIRKLDLVAESKGVE